MKTPTASFLALMIAASVSLGTIACKSPHKGPDETQSSANSKNLVVYGTSNATQVREKAQSYGLDVRTIDTNTAGGQLAQALLNSPTDRYLRHYQPGSASVYWRGNHYQRKPE